MVCLRTCQSLVSLPWSLNQVWYHRSSEKGTIVEVLRNPMSSNFSPHTYKPLYSFLIKTMTLRWRLYNLFFPENAQWWRIIFSLYLSNQILNTLVISASKGTLCLQSYTANKQLICFSILWKENLFLEMFQLPSSIF